MKLTFCIKLPTYNEMWSNGYKIAFFSKKLQKIAQRLGASPPDPQSVKHLSYTGFLYTFPKLDICIFQLLV